MTQVEYARGMLRRLDGDPGENRELAVFNLEKAIQDYEANINSDLWFKPVLRSDETRVGGSPGHLGPPHHQNAPQFRLAKSDVNDKHHPSPE